MNSVFPDNTPKVETVVYDNRPYSRIERRKGTFVVKSGGEYVRMIDRKSMKFDTVSDLKQASVFSYKNAQLVGDIFLSMNPVVFMAYKKDGKIVTS